MKASKRGYLFSLEREDKINEKFKKLTEVLEGKINDTIHGLKSCTKEEEIAMKYLYTTMPISDIGDYHFSIFLHFARHGIHLWKSGNYCKDISEDIFLNYVMHHRVNNEDIVPCREFFYDKIIDFVKGKQTKEAILEINYWCAKEATYQATDDRTISPIGVYNSAFGRCGEESTFTVTALRSVGIPARQVYVPRWSHCDDNHAWVEVYCEGRWHFLGACEPEEILNKGWFTSASSRAMMVHSRWFDYLNPVEEIIGKSGMATIINNLNLYANTTRLEIVIRDGNGNAVKDVEVDIEVLNYSEYFPIATLVTNEDGKISITVGLGNINIHVHKNDVFVDKIVDTREIEGKTIEIELEKEIRYESWHEFDLIAPLDAPINTEKPTEKQKEIGSNKFAKAKEVRIAKVESFYNESRVKAILSKCKDREKINEIFKLSRGNSSEVEKFLLSELDLEEEKFKEDILKVLTLKDFRDFKSDILKAHLKNTVKFSNKYEDKIFKKYILNPRINYETLTDYSSYIIEYFAKENQEFVKNPKIIWDYVNENIKEVEEFEYKGIITSPVGCLKVKVGNKISRKVLFVAICRSLGIPARINEIDGMCEFYEGKNFIAVEIEAEKTSILEITSKDEKVVWIYFSNWSIAKLNDGVYESLNLSDIEWNNGITLKVEPGEYRVITSNRLPNGNIFAKKFCFVIEDKEKIEINLQLRDAEISEMLEDIQISDFELSKDDESRVKASEIIKSSKKLLIWLDESKEPTEHILNEIYERREEFKKLCDKVIFIIKGKESLKDHTLKRTIYVLENLQIYYDPYEENINILARRMYVEPDKLPLIIVIDKGLHGIYATSGYNVGTGDMLLRILV